MDRIELHTELACIVGILARERVEPQPLIFDVAMHVDLDACGRTGRLETSVDYGAVDAQIRFLATHGAFRLIESLSVALLGLLLAEPAPGDERAALQRASIRIAKPTVLRSAVPAVALERDAAWAQELPSTLDGDVHHRMLCDLPEVTARLVHLPAGARLASDGRGADRTLVLRTSAEVSLPFTADRPESLLWVQSRPWSPA